MPEAIYSLAGKRVWVAGHVGMVGSALERRLASEDCIPIRADRSQVDLTDQRQTLSWIEEARPDAVFVAAAKVGGIHANDQLPATFLYDNLMIEANVINAARQVGVGKLLFLGSSCIYPRLAAQPIAESALLTGPLEPTNEWYAIAKIAGIKLCQAYRRQYGCDFISAMPTNLYGPRDNFGPQSSHVAPALMVKAHLAKLAGRDWIDVWGSGRPRREFLHVDDLVDGAVHLMTRYSGPEPVNIGAGEDLTVRALAELICEVVGFTGDLRFDADKPDGTPRKLLDISRMRSLGWNARIGLRDGLAQTYDWYLRNGDDARSRVALRASA